MTPVLVALAYAVVAVIALVVVLIIWASYGLSETLLDKESDR